MTEARVGGGALQLVTVCLSDDGAGELATSSAGRSSAHWRSRICAPAARASSCSVFWSSAELADRRSEALV